MKISIFLILFFISIPIIFSYNLTKFLHSERFLEVEAVIKLMETTFIPYERRLSISTTPEHNYSMRKSDMISNFLQSLKSQIKYKLTDKIIEKDRASYHNVIILSDYNDFRLVCLPLFVSFFNKLIFRFFSNTMNPIAYNYQGFFFIIIGFYTNEDLKKIYEDLFKKYILNANIIVVNNENRKEILIYTYFPFEENNCRGINPIIWNVFKNEKLTEKKIVFPKKLQNMNRCEVNVSVFERPPFIFLKKINNKLKVSGIEGSLLNTLSKSINFTFDIQVITEDIISKLNQSNVPAEIIKRFFCSLSIGALGQTGVSLGLTVSTKAYIHMYLQFVFPYENPVTPFAKFLYPFQKQTWYYICLIFCLAGIVIIILKFTKRDTRNFIIGPTNTPLFDLITIFLKNPITRIAPRNFARTLTIHWMFLSLIISTAYQGTLFECLQRAESANPIYTIDELVKDGFKFLMPVYHKRLFSLLPEVFENVEFTKKNSSGLLKKQAILLNEFSLNYLNKRSTRFASSNNIFLYPVSILLKNSTYLKPKFDNEIERYLSSGLIKYWIGDYKDVVDNLHTREPSELTVDELLGGFEICLIFYFFSIFVFLIELLSVKFVFVRRILNWLTY